MRGFSRLVFSLLLGRTAGQMLAISLVLFVLGRYHSAQLAGAAAALIVFPGLVVSPIAGALLDRYGRSRLVTIDYIVSATTLFALAGLSAGNLLPAPALLAICAVSSLTGPLSAAGARSLFPTVVPADLWERANAVDSTSYVLATVIGAPLAGILVGFAGGEWALAVAGLLFLGAAIAIVVVQHHAVQQKGGHLLADAWSGLLYVLRNRTLTGLALTFFAFNVGWGCVVIAVPVLLLGQLHQGPATVGYVWGAVGIAGVIGTLVAGRIHTRGRERQLMVVSMGAVAAALALLPLAGSVAIVAASLLAVAIVETPFDIAFLTLRQRRTDPARFGRMFAVSMSLNVLGTPVGSALAGPLIGRSLTVALWFAVVAVLVAAVLPLIAIPGDEL